MNKKSFVTTGVVLYVTFLSTFLSYAQKIEEDTINGIAYYVYPFANEITLHNNIYVAVKMPRGSRTSYKEYFVSAYGEDYDKKEFRKMRRKAYFGLFRQLKYRRQYKHLYSSSFKHAVRKNPFPLIEQKYTLDSDIIPSLDPIPDGKYVQYFSNYFDVKPNGRMIYNENKVAGFFTIKKNTLEGEAVWFNAKGDTLKYGRFEKGLKVGDWYLETRKVSFTLSKKDAKDYISRGCPDQDTTREYVHFKSGFKDGSYKYFNNSKNPIIEGDYAKNEMSEKWTYRDVTYSGVGKNKKRNRNNDIITLNYTLADKETVVKQTVIRRSLVLEADYSNEEYDFSPKYSPSVSLSKFYSFNFPKELDLELEEEKLYSYEGEEYEEEEYYDEGDYSNYIEEEEDIYYDFKNYVFDPTSGKNFTAAHLIDSLGIIFQYDGVYEKYYPNGQLILRYEFKDGKLLEEDTIFWDNGTPLDVIRFDRDSNHYVQSVFDYNGKLYNEIVYDQKGEFKRVAFQPERIKYLNIDGFVASDEPDSRYFFYDHKDTLLHQLNDSLVIFQSWYKVDTCKLYMRNCYPDERKITYSSFGVTGKSSLKGEMLFAENYESWSGTKEYELGNINLHTTTSASLLPYIEKDSIPQLLMNQYEEGFELTEDYVLKQNGTPFTGEFKLVTNENKFELVSNKKISLVLPRASAMSEKLYKQLAKFKRNGTTKFETLFGSIDASEFDEDFGSTIFGNLLGGFLSFIEYPTSYEWEEYDNNGHYKEKDLAPFMKMAKGSFRDGKPQGDWQIIDQFGNLLYEMTFDKGELNGKLKEFDIAYPSEVTDYYEEEVPFDSMPKRETHYLYSEAEYKNGMANGDYLRYNWYGELNERIPYKDGYENGPAFERNSLAHTNLNYLDGELDGYVRTYLTLNGQDSVLLYDLNFQNGLLQGESKAYHMSGRLAKKGFFLNGEPIEDYEAYDTLGFKYHYVKFQYSFPIEEKIWEENELSVRYLFDWRDSIYFQPTDITSTQSLDRVLANLGLAGDYYERPYYGRPSIVNKEGIDYHITKYYPNDTIARDGDIAAGKKVGCWKYYSYDGEFLYEANYFDTIISINDSIQFKAKGILADYDQKGNKISESYIIEKFEKYDCSHTDHYEIRQLMTIWQGKDSIDRINGYVKNYYDNGVLQNEGLMKNGLPTGVWKFYDPYGKLNQVGSYTLGKRDGRWLGGDLSKTKYLGDICLNPNLPDLEEELKYREKQLDIVITNYQLGKALNKEFYDVNMNDYEEEEGESLESEE
ncbi:MAG: hypothetical protein ACK50Y_10345 [Flavobacteriia bacterium]|jgi:antitoxin component YwqK of YwqJK toxin-antitoxin module